MVFIFIFLFFWLRRKTVLALQLKYRRQNLQQNLKCHNSKCWRPYTHLAICYFTHNRSCLYTHASHSWQLFSLNIYIYSNRLQIHSGSLLLWWDFKCTLNVKVNFLWGHKSWKEHVWSWKRNSDFSSKKNVFEYVTYKWLKNLFCFYTGFQMFMFSYGPKIISNKTTGKFNCVIVSCSFKSYPCG